ncbi:uncharacterized protein N7477_004759 [Penicillium maclennaniae]|uniref:uncharacterized protein n=1 Tax=Penicillium maclennaniae TaxID=1343394 RepID=UPI00254212B7|nr:uncharacterized protein N7477_004759 [Penicillium maclennaniae]KAJ5674825.1 hypothetical protein N7477_004759 [Penicillium maclennaniae]
MAALPGAVDKAYIVESASSMKREVSVEEKLLTCLGVLRKIADAEFRTWRGKGKFGSPAALNKCRDARGGVQRRTRDLKARMRN